MERTITPKDLARHIVDLHKCEDPGDLREPQSIAEHCEDEIKNAIEDAKEGHGFESPRMRWEYRPRITFLLALFPDLAPDAAEQLLKDAIFEATGFNIVGQDWLIFPGNPPEDRRPERMSVSLDLEWKKIPEKFGEHPTGKVLAVNEWLHVKFAHIRYGATTGRMTCPEFPDDAQPIYYATVPKKLYKALLGLKDIADYIE